MDESKLIVEDSKHPQDCMDRGKAPDGAFATKVGNDALEFRGCRPERSGAHGPSDDRGGQIQPRRGVLALRRFA